MKQYLKTLVVAVLTFEAKILLRRTKPTIIAVTGSVGKTSTKDAIFAALRGSVHTRKSEKSYNSELGVPLSILGLENAWSNPILWLKNCFDGLMIALFPGDYPKVLVLETGVDRPGDMGRLTAWLTPDIVVLTRLPDVPVHVEYFSAPEEVVREKMKLVEALSPEGILIYNHDDPIIQREVAGVRHQAIGYSRYLPSPYTIKDDHIFYRDDVPAGVEFTLAHVDEAVSVRLSGSLGTQHAYNCAAAAAVAAQFGIPLAAVAAAVAEFIPPPGRMRVIPGIKGTILIDDTYNSSPIAVEAALTALAELRGAKRKIAVLGDMLELGRYSVREHERMGELAARTVDFLITVGVRSRKTAEGALEHGLSEKVILQYDDAESAGRELQALLAPGDVVLVKGSQGVRAERIVEELMAEPERAAELLVRQDRMWRARA